MKTAIKLIPDLSGNPAYLRWADRYSFYYHCPYEWWERRCHPGFGVDIGSFDAAFHGSDVFIYGKHTIYPKTRQVGHSFHFHF